MKLWLFIFLAFLISGCGSGGSSNSDTTIPFIETTSVSIAVTDIYGVPIASASISAREQDKPQDIISSAITDTNGLVVMGDIPVKSNMVFVFDKQDYTAQVKSLLAPDTETTIRLEIVMLKREEPQLFNPNEEQDLDGRDGINLVLDADALVDANGNPVSGEVSVQMTPVDVSTAAGIQAFPGDFAGIPENESEPQMLVSFGSVEFVFTQNGEELQLAEGQTATIDLPMYIDTYPDGSAVNIGDNIPLWSLDEQTGIWIQEGEGEVIEKPASPTGLAMRAEVSHFSWWNTDWYPQDADLFDINLALRGIDQNSEVTDEINGMLIPITVSAPGTAIYTNKQIGDSVVQPVFDGTWCFEIPWQVRFNFLTEQSVALESQKRCYAVEEGMTINIDVTFENVEFGVENELRSTATAGANYGACLDIPRLKALTALPVEFNIVSGALPDGLSFQSNGVLAGTPTTPGQYNFSVEVVEIFEGERMESEVIDAEITVSPELTIDAVAVTSRPVFNIGYAATFEAPFTADGGFGDLKFKEAPTSRLPIGMSMDEATSTLSGTPGGRFIVNGEPQIYYATDVIAIVEDENCATATAQYQQDVIWAPKLEGEPPLAIAQQPFSFTLTNTEGPIENWQANSSLPAWLNLNGVTGEMTGTPPLSEIGESYDITLQANGPEIEALPPD